MNDKRKIDDVLYYTLDIARMNGATEAEVYIEDVKRTRIKLSRNLLEEIGTSRERGLGLRVLKDQKLGFGFTSSLERDSIMTLLKRCLNMTHYGVPDEKYDFVGFYRTKRSNQGIYDDQLVEVGLDEKVNLVRKNEEQALAYDSSIVSVDASTYQDEIKSVYLATSKGFHSHYKSTLCQTDILCIARSSSHGTKEYDYRSARDFHSVSKHKTGDIAARRAIVPLNGKPVASGTYQVIMEPLPVIEMLYAMFPALLGDNAMQGSSCFSGDIGQKIGSDRVSIIDDGKRVSGINTVPFDGEGTPPEKTVLFANGILEGFLYDNYTAARCQQKSTGNCHRYSYRHKPGAGLSNLYLEQGLVSPDSMISSIDRGLLITTTTNTGGINPISGAYSVSASGVLIEKGRLTEPIDSITLSGTIAGILANIVELGSDMSWFGPVGAPSIMISSIIVSGK